MAILGCRLVGICKPRREKNLVVYVEMDRCFIDAIGFFTGCSLGKRSMLHIDYGKPAATFYNRDTGTGYRIAVLANLRTLVNSGQNGEAYYFDNSVANQKSKYSELPDYELFRVEPVIVNKELTETGFKRNKREICRVCCEEINDQKGIRVKDGWLCAPCESPSDSYYTSLSPAPSNTL